MNENLPIKLILIGGTGVGKTSLINQYKLKKFYQTNVSTVGVDLTIDKNVKINGRSYDISIWDTAGQEKYKSIVKMSCRDSDVALVCFDLSDAKSAESLPGWINFLRDNCPIHLQIIIVGTKSDKKSEIAYTKEQLETMLNKLKDQFNESFDIYTTSAQTGEGLKEVFSKGYEKGVQAKYESNSVLVDDEGMDRNVLLQQNAKSFKLNQQSVRRTEQIVSNTASVRNSVDPKSQESGCCSQ